ncbi:unnamed protein product [Orchesella dallaii]|uniref:Uncharacterized protein n=1 Tax=Orchesella dallaii TaxID=48710 RepID=A0ABP1S0P6_9HEXA
MPITSFDELFEKLKVENQKLKEENQRSTTTIMNTLTNIQDEQAKINTRINDLENKVKKSGEECTKRTKAISDDMKDIQSMHTQRMRIGKPADGKTRPLRVQLNSNNEVHAAMQNAKLLKDIQEFNGIYARMDQTKQQQQERKKYISSKRAADSDDEDMEYAGPASKQRAVDTASST